MNNFIISDMEKIYIDCLSEEILVQTRCTTYESKFYASAVIYQFKTTRDRIIDG